MQRVASVTPRGHRTRIAACVIALLAVVSPALAQRAPAPAPTTTLNRIREAGTVRLGYRTDARPFSYQDEGGKAAGYSVALCLAVVDAIKAELVLTALNVEWVPVTVADRFTAVRQGKIDLLCGSETETLARRKEVAFSIPIFPGGIGAMVRSDAPARLKDILMGRRSTQPNWRASAGQLLQEQIFSVVTGTTAEPWLNGKLNEFQLRAKVVPVDGYQTGIQQLLDRKANVFFGDRAILLDAATRDASGGKLMVLERSFTYEPLALTLGRGEEDFRLVVDRTLSRLYASGDIRTLYVQWFGEPDQNALAFFRWSTLPE